MNEKRRAELAEMMEKSGVTAREVVLDLLFMYYEAAGFRTDELENELNAKTDEELVALYCDL